MKMFLSRIRKTGKDISTFLITVLVATIVAIPIVSLIFVLPLWGLGKINNWLPMIYISSFFVGVPIWVFYNDIKVWFYWQFIEPFKKENRKRDFNKFD